MASITGSKLNFPEHSGTKSSMGGEVEFEWVVEYWGGVSVVSGQRRNNVGGQGEG